LLKIIQEKKIDIIHFYFPEHFVCLPLLRKKLFGNIPVVLSINGVPGYDWFYNNKYVDFIGKIYSKIILSRIIRNVDMIVPYSTVTINTLVSLGCDRRKIKSIVAHGVDVQFFYPADNKEKLREKYGLPKDAFIIIYTGRFVEVKRLDILIRAIGKVFKSIENVFLLLVGDGSLKEKLVSLAKTSCEGHIKFMDFVDHATLSEMYGASDMFALISSGEGISSSLLEACSSGLPSLVSNAGANGEIVKNGFNGYMLDMITEEGLAENIIEIKKNAKNLSDNARRYAIENLDWSIIINNYSEIYSLLRN
jgi:glycosyltransferase involved in cell wall biosynthesis